MGLVSPSRAALFAARLSFFTGKIFYADSIRPQQFRRARLDDSRTMGGTSGRRLERTRPHGRRVKRFSYGHCCKSRVATHNGQRSERGRLRVLRQSAHVLDARRPAALTLPPRPLPNSPETGLPASEGERAKLIVPLSEANPTNSPESQNLRESLFRLWRSRGIVFAVTGKLLRTSQARC